MSEQTLIGKILQGWKNKYRLPKHRLGLPEFVLKLTDKFAPYKEVEQENIEYVNDKDRPVLHIFGVKAIKGKKAKCLQLINVNFKFIHKFLKSLSKIVVLHSLSYLQPRIIQELLYRCVVSRALHKIMIELSKEVPIFDHRGIYTFL